MAELQRRAVATSKAPAPAFSYSQRIAASGLCFISGQVPMNPERRAVPAGFDAQARQALDNVAAIAEAAGGRPADAPPMTVYLADLVDFEEMDAAYRTSSAEPLPARTTIGIEIDAIIALAQRA